MNSKVFQVIWVRIFWCQLAFAFHSFFVIKVITLIIDVGICNFFSIFFCLLIKLNCCANQEESNKNQIHKIKAIEHKVLNWYFEWKVSWIRVPMNIKRNVESIDILGIKQKLKTLEYIQSLQSNNTKSQDKKSQCWIHRHRRSQHHSIIGLLYQYPGTVFITKIIIVCITIIAWLNSSNQVVTTKSWARIIYPRLCPSIT